MTITNPQYASVADTAGDITITALSGDYLVVRSLDGAGIVAFLIKSVGGLEVNDGDPSVTAGNNYLLPSVKDAEQVVRLNIPRTVDGTEVVIRAIASSATKITAWMDED